MDERHFQHATEVFCGLLEACEDAAGFFEPADQALDDAALSVRFTIEGDGARLAMVAVFARNHWFNSQFEEVLIDPIGPVAFVTSQSDRPSERFSRVVDKFAISSHEQHIENGRIMSLTRREMKMEWVAMAITQQVNFCGKTAARTA